MSDSWSLPAKWMASSTESGRGEATRTKAVSGWVRSSRTRAGPLAEPLLHALEGLEEGDGVAHHVGAGHLGEGPEQRLGGHPHEPEAGPGRHHQRPEDPVAEEPGQPAGGVEEVEGVRDGGVSTTTTSNPPSSASS